MRQVLVEHTVQVTLVDDEEPVEAFTPNSAYSPFGERIEQREEHGMILADARSEFAIRVFEQHRVASP